MLAGIRARRYEPVIIQAEREQYDDEINAVGVLKVTDRETLSEAEYLIEHIVGNKVFLSQPSEFFLLDDDRYDFEWVAVREHCLRYTCWVHICPV